MKHKINLALLTILGVFINGCSLLAPDRPDPIVDIPASFQFGEIQVESNLPYIAWWQKFDDKNLNQLIESGLVANNSIAEAKANIHSAQGQLKSIELSWIPSISLFAGIFNMYPILPQPQSFYGGFAGYDSLNIFSQIAKQKSAKINLEAKQEAFEGTKLDVITNIAIAYYTLISQEAQLKLYQQYVNDIIEQINIHQKRKNGGLANTAEGIPLEQNLKQAKSQLKSIENNIIVSRNALNYLLNRNPGTAILTSDFNNTKIPYANLTSTPASVIGNRPDIKVAALQFKVAAQNITATYTELLPSFQLLYGPTQLISGGLPGMPDGSYVDFQSEFVNWSLKPSIFGDVEKYEGSEKYYYANYIDSVRKALRDVSNDLASNNITNERYRLTQSAAADATRKYSYTYNMYKTGLKSYSDTLQDKITQDEALISVNQMKLSQMHAIISLYKDLGGGYRFNESEVVSSTTK